MKLYNDHFLCPSERQLAKLAIFPKQDLSAMGFSSQELLFSLKGSLCSGKVTAGKPGCDSPPATD